MKTFNLDDVVTAYLACAAWCSSHSDEDGNIEHDSLEEFDFCDEAMARAKQDCDAFLVLASAQLQNVELDAEQIGHDFWLTRNGHGSGFWDLGLGEVGENLSKIAQTFGTCDCYLISEDLIDFM